MLSRVFLYYMSIPFWGIVATDGETDSQEEQTNNNGSPPRYVEADYKKIPGRDNVA